MNHRRPYETAEAAKSSKAYTASPGATVEYCPCGKYHVYPPKKAARSNPDRNSHPTPAVRKLVLERDGYACVCCGRSVIGQRYSLGHRKRASHGGKPVPSNLITLLGWGGEACHGRIDLYKDDTDAAKGYRVESWQDPVAVPVTVFSEHEPVWLGENGGYLYAAPEARAA